jgi:hypothetical protein
MRRINDPAGAEWFVDVDWTGRRVGTRIERRLERHAARRDNRATKGSPSRHRRRDLWGDTLDPDAVSAFFEFGVAAWVVVSVITAIVAIAVLGPWVLVVFIDLLELLVFPLIAGVVAGWRVARRHSFTIVAARYEFPIAVWKVVGFRSARRIERAIAEAIKVGGNVEDLFPEYREVTPPSVDAAR